MQVSHLNFLIKNLDHQMDMLLDVENVQKSGKRVIIRKRVTWLKANIRPRTVRMS
jgi:hypothetical protein